MGRGMIRTLSAALLGFVSLASPRVSADDAVKIGAIQKVELTDRQIDLRPASDRAVPAVANATEETNWDFTRFCSRALAEIQTSTSATREFLGRQWHEKPAEMAGATVGVAGTVLLFGAIRMGSVHRRRVASAKAIGQVHEQVSRAAGILLSEVFSTTVIYDERRSLPDRLRILILDPLSPLSARFSAPSRPELDYVLQIAADKTGRNIEQIDFTAQGSDGITRRFRIGPVGDLSMHNNSSRWDSTLGPKRSLTQAREMFNAFTAEVEKAHQAFLERKAHLERKQEAPISTEGISLDGDWSGYFDTGATY